MRKACFLDFCFDTGNVTLFPRPETEILVEKAVEYILSSGLPRPYILDIGTGCGNIAISLTKYLPSSRIVALDISHSALRVARENAEKYAVSDRIEFIQGDLLGALDAAYALRFDLIVANPPYVSLRDFYSLSQAVKDEPYAALFGGPDGLRFYRRISRRAHYFMKNNAALMLEAGYDQAAEVRKILENAGVYGDFEVYNDYNGIQRIVKARRVHG